MSALARSTTSVEPRAHAPRAEGGTLEPGRNCWRLERAEKFRCVQDGAEYFELAREAILSAERTIFILGWDISYGVDLLPGGADGRGPTKLGELLDFVVRRRRELRCYVLVWDYAAVYALERDPFTRWRMGWGTHRRVHFRYDGQHPFGASHHQKVLVVDDRLAFSGGLDLTGHRWDTKEHPIEHPLRRNALGQPYTPFHDTQALVEGPIAASLGELARERWRRLGRRRLGRRRLPPLAPSARSLWPRQVAPDLVDVDVAIARTEPAFRGHAGVRENEQLFLDAIASARRTIYIENQYFTNARVGAALARRLREAEGPEVVLIGPKECSGWLEQQTMGALRASVYSELVRSDRHGRLRLLHAVASREHSICTFVHAKTTIVDDELLRIGSANVSNRSMGMDTECDLAVEARGRPDVRAGIARVRARLVAEHVGHGADEVERAIAAHGSLRAAIDALGGGDRTLVPIDVEKVELLVDETTLSSVADPREPMQVTRSIDRLLPELEADDRRGGVPAYALPLGVMAFLAIVAAHLTDPGAFTTLVGLREVLALAPEAPLVALTAFGLFAAAALLFVPLDLLLLATSFLLGPWLGLAVSIAGASAAASTGYGLGRVLGARRLRRWIGPRAHRLVRELHGRGATSVAVVRLAPLATFGSVSLACGVARVPPREYAAGTALGVTPWIVALVALGSALRVCVLHPSPIASASTSALALALAFAVLRLRHGILARRADAAALEQAERARLG